MSHDALRARLDNTSDDPRHRAPLVLGDNDFASVTDTVCRLGRGRRQTPRRGTSRSASSASLTRHPRRDDRATCSATGIGVWGLNNPVGWAWDITNFVFWIGIGHAGTLISRDPLPVPAEVAHRRSTASPRR